MTAVVAPAPVGTSRASVAPGLAAAAGATVLVALSLLGRPDDLAAGFPALAVPGSAGQPERVVALLVALLLLAAVWLARADRPWVSVGLGVAAAGWLVPSWAAMRWLSPAGGSLALAAPPLLVAGLAHAGLRWRSVTARRAAAVYVVAAVATAVHAASYNAFDDPGCNLTCRDAAPLLSSVLSTSLGVNVAAAGTLAAAATGALAIVWPPKRVRDLVSSAAVVAIAAVALSTALRWATWRSPERAAHWQTVGDRLELAAVALLSMSVIVGMLRVRRVRRALVRIAAEVSAQPVGRVGRPDEVHFYVPGERRWVDRAGTAVDRPAGHRVDVLRGTDGEPLLRLVSRRLRSAVDQPPDLSPAMRLGLDNARLEAVALARQRDVQASQRRLVSTADAERLRIQRDLHDGAQQRLVSAALHLQVANARVDATRAEVIAAAEHQVRSALVALRELTHAMSAGVLAEEGLSAALEDLVAASAVPTQLTVHLPQTPMEDVATAVYAAVVAGLDNIAEHAEARQAAVSIRSDSASVVLRVTDDGRGGAVLGRGLTEVSDRVGAVGGSLRVDSPVGGGTELHVVIPCGS